MYFCNLWYSQYISYHRQGVRLTLSGLFQGTSSGSLPNLQTSEFNLQTSKSKLNPQPRHAVQHPLRRTSWMTKSLSTIRKVIKIEMTSIIYLEDTLMMLSMFNDDNKTLPQAKGMSRRLLRIRSRRLRSNKLEPMFSLQVNCPLPPIWPGLSTLTM